MSTQNPPKPLSIWRIMWELARFTPHYYIGIILLRLLIFAAAPQATGLITRSFFDSLTGQASAGWNAYTLSALVIGVALARSAAIIIDITMHFSFLFMAGTLLRKNLFERVLDCPGARPCPPRPERPSAASEKMWISSSSSTPAILSGSAAPSSRWHPSRL
jgi:ATP-binding cassette, subfamily B, bacterial